MRVELCLYYYFSMAWAVNVRYAKFNQDHEAYGTVCNPSDRLLSIHDQSLISCCAFCKTELECKSVSFNQLNKTCILCGALNVSESPIQDINMAHYFWVQEGQNESSEVQNVVTTTEVSDLSSSTELTLATIDKTDWIGYKDFFYAYVHRKTQWAKAEEICMAFGNNSVLVSVTSGGEARFIHNNFVGESDAGVKEYSWVKSVTQTNGKVVKSEQPDINNGEMMCISIFSAGIRITPCNETLRFTCEKPAIPGL